MGTTFRTAEYERRVPYSVLSKGARDLIAENASKREPIGGNYQDVLLKQFKNEKAKTADELVEAYPFIDELADEMVNARLGLYNKAPTYDKSEGWIENLEDIQQPYPLEFTVVNGEPVLTPFGELMSKQDFAKSFAESKDVQKWIDHPTKQKITFTRGKRGDENQHWYRTMDEYSDALLNDIGSEYSRALQWLLQRKLNERIKADLESPEPQYIDALKNKLLPDFDYSQGNPTYEDYDKYQTDQNKSLFGRMEFERPSGLKTVPASFVAPMYSATHFDPELDYNTSKKEAAARLVGDVALDAVGVGAPVAGAKVGGKVFAKAVPYFRNVARRTGAALGGAVGGAGSYFADRGADWVAEQATGKGYHQYPVDARDLGLQMLLGGVSGVPWSNRVPSYNEMRPMIDKNFPDLVTRTDIKDMIGAQKDAQKLIKKGKGKTGAEGIENQYQDRAWRDYRKKFGEDEAIQVELPPKVEGAGGTPLVQNAPAGKPRQTRDSNGDKVRVGTMEHSGKLMDTRTPMIYDASGNPIARAETEHAYEKADAELVNRYFKDNEKYFAGMPEEEKADLVRAMNASREKDSPYAKFFSGEPEIMRVPDWRQQVRTASGRTVNEGDKPLKNKGVEWVLRNKSKTGQDKGGVFIEAGADQQKAFNKAKEDSHRRYGHTMLGGAKLYSDPQTSGTAKKLAKGGARLASGVNAVLHNVVPYSNLVGGVPPMTYTKTKENK